MTGQVTGEATVEAIEEVIKVWNVALIVIRNHRQTGFY
jgi:nucleotide-binding universal stress UspA family protein